MQGGKKEGVGTLTGAEEQQPLDRGHRHLRTHLLVGVPGGEGRGRTSDRGLEVQARGWKAASSGWQWEGRGRCGKDVGKIG